LARLFPWRKAALLLFGVGLLAVVFQQQYGDGKISYVRAFYAILNMATFQISYDDIPEHPNLDVFFVLVPLVGIPLFVTIAADLLNVLRVFLVRNERGQRWQTSLAATIEHPVVVCGVEDRVAYRIASQIADLGRRVVGVEPEPGPLADALTERDIPVIHGDIRNEDVLRSAGVKRARAVLVCTHEDLMNVEAAYRIREINPQARIVLRLFEDEIADEIQSSFNIQSVLSRSALAAQAFAHAAIGVEVIETSELGAQIYALAKVPLRPASALAGQTVGFIAEDEDVTIVCLYREGNVYLEPLPETVLRAGDTLYVFTRMQHLAELVQPGECPPHEARPGVPVLVCGLGHTGYRVVNALLALNQPVLALDFEPSRLSKRLEDHGVPVAFGDFRQRALLEEAGVAEACAIIACTDDDMVNFEAVLRARKVNPQIRAVLRIFEEALGQQLQHAFNIDAARSTSAIAAPAFVEAALKTKVPEQSVRVGDEQYYISRLVIEALSLLYRESIGALTQEEDLTVLLHKRNDAIEVPPSPTQTLKYRDEIVVLATQEKMHELIRRNRGRSDRN
jgi:Trk K+ transport system NAD-binding subunit